MAVKIKKNPEKPETTEILAEAIVRISEAFDKLLQSGLNEKAIIVLLQDRTKLPQRDIASVLEHLRTLAGYYCRK